MCKTIIDDIDSNKDQIIDYNEFTALMRSALKSSNKSTKHIFLK